MVVIKRDVRVSKERILDTGGNKNIPLHDASKASLNTGALRSLLSKSDERRVTNYRLLGHPTAPRPRRRELLLFYFSTVNFRKKIQILLTEGHQERNVV